MDVRATRHRDLFDNRYLLPTKRFWTDFFPNTNGSVQ